MLGRVVGRSLRPLPRLTSSLPRQARPDSLHVFRSYAKYTKPPVNPQATTSSPKTPSSSSSSSTSHATGSARQTSPGTSLPKDKTWKPKDAIKFGGPGVAAAGGANAASKIPEQKDTISAETAEFNTTASSEGNTAPSEQPASPRRAADATKPLSSTSGDSEAANVEFEGPKDSEANTEAHTEPEPPRGPLPDLRQGIPSTFDAEFGFGGKGSGKNAAASTESSENFDITAAEPNPSGERPPREEEYRSSDYETSTDRSRAKLARYMYMILGTFIVTGGAYFSRPYGDDEEVPGGLQPAQLSEWSPGAMWARVKSRMSGSMEYYTEPTSRKLLPEVPESQRPPFTLVLSLEDLMIHSEWTREHGWRTAKRPGIDYFLRYLSQYYELVLFTSVPFAMGDPVMKKLDPFRMVMWPLFREATKYENGKYVKDLAYLNRPLDKTIMIDTKAEHVANQPENAIILPKWKGDSKDPHARDLVALIPFLEYIATMGIQDTRKVIESFQGTDIPTEFARRESLAREEFNKQLALERQKRGKSSLGGLFANSFGLKGQGGGLTFDNETSVADGLKEGKMLSDQIRERGQRQYEALEMEIRKNGEKWLKEMEEEEKRLMDESVKDMRKSWFPGAGGSRPAA